MINLQYLMFLPIGIGIILFIIPESLKPIKGIFNLLVSSAILYFSILVFKMKSGLVNIECFSFPSVSKYLILNVDNLSKLIALFIGVFGFRECARHMTHNGHNGSRLLARTLEKGATSGNTIGRSTWLWAGLPTSPCL